MGGGACFRLTGAGSDGAQGELAAACGEAAAMVCSAANWAEARRFGFGFMAAAWRRLHALPPL